MERIEIDSMLNRLQNAILNSREPKEKESKKESYYEKVIYDFNKGLVEIPIPNHSLILYGETGKGKTLLLNYWHEVLGEKSCLVYEPDLITELNSFDFRSSSISWIYKKYIFIDECFDLSSHKSMTENGKKNYLSLLEKIIYRKTKPIVIVSTNHINFSMFAPKVERRWKDLLLVDGKIKAKEIK